MRITVDVSSFYDWEAVPADVKVTDADVKARRVKPDSAGTGFLMRVTRAKASHTHVALSEATIIARIIQEHMPQGGSRMLTRREAVANVLAANIMPDHAHPRHMKAFHVEADDGPDEKLFRAMLEPYTTTKHHSGELLVEPADIEALVAKYLEPASIEDHVAHLHARFNVARTGQ